MIKKQITIIIATILITLLITGCIKNKTNKNYFQYNDFWQEVTSNFQLNNINNSEITQELNLYLKNKHDLEKTLIRATPYLWYIKQQLIENNMPTELILLPIIESGYRPFASSWAGASGLWQMMPGTASGLGLKINWWIDERRNITKSTNAAITYLKYLHGYFDNNWILAIASYDSGAGTVQKAINKLQHSNFWKLNLPKETQKYIPKLFALKIIINNAKHYDVQLPSIPNQPFFTTVSINKSIPLQDIAKLANITDSEIRKLNPEFRRWSTSPKRKYQILIPANKYNLFNQNLAKYRYKQHHPKLKKYTIKKGDNISLIAKKLKTNKQKIIEINQLHSIIVKTGSTLLVPKKKTIKIPGFNYSQTKKINADQHPGPKKTIHIYKKHDTLQKLAKKSKVKVSAIKYWNQIRSYPKTGDHIIIWKHPPKIPKKYTVKKGDSLIKIAKKFKTSVKHIKNLNHLHNNIIKIRQQLNLR